MKIEKKTCTMIAVTVFVLYLAIYYWKAISGIMLTILGASSPLIVGCVIAYVVNILMSFFERYFFIKSNKPNFPKVRRAVCLMLAIIVLSALMVLIVVLVLPQLISCLQLIFEEAVEFIGVSYEWLKSKNMIPQDVVESVAQINWYSKISQIGQEIASGIGKVTEVLLTVVTSVFSGVITTFISIIFAIYLLVSKEKLEKQTDSLIRRYMSNKLYVKTKKVFSLLNDCFHRYIVGQCTEAVILGLLCTLGMLVLQIPYATMIGAFIAFTAMVPIAGAYIGASVGFLMILSVAPLKALIFLIFIVVLQQLEGNLIYPKVVGSSMGLPGIWVLAAVTIGGGTMGVAGMFLGVPLAATLYRLLREDIRDNPNEKVVSEDVDKVDENDNEIGQSEKKPC